MAFCRVGWVERAQRRALCKIANTANGLGERGLSSVCVWIKLTGIIQVNLPVSLGVMLDGNGKCVQIGI